MAALLHKVASGEPTTLPATTALAMATRTGAAAIRMADTTGQLKPGMQADMIQVDYTGLGRQPIYDIRSHLVYTLDASDVVTTIVAGKLLMQNREVLTLDEAALRSDVQKASDKVRNALTAQAPGQ